jgi:FkbM family methyltransferase
MISYSQVNQDIWVVKTLNGKRNGYFLDVGAFDGIKFSNSYLLEKFFRWDGLLVEAHPDNFSKLISCRSSKSINAAISDFCGVTAIEYAGSTGSKISHTGIEVNSLTLRNLFYENNVPTIIDYMSLDIEGFELNALNGFPFETHICLTVTIEHNLYCEGPVNKNKIKELMFKNGYILDVEDVCCDGNPFEDWYIHHTIKK